MTKPTNIMLVDDVEYTRDLLRTAINAAIIDEELDIEPKYVMLSGGQRVVRLVEEKAVQLVYLDIELLDTNGINVLKQVKAKYPETFVVMVSGESSNENVTGAIEHGANGFIVKPFNTVKVVKSLKNYIKSRG